MVTCEFYAKGHFPGFARPFVYNAEILQKFVDSFLLMSIELHLLLFGSLKKRSI